MPMRWRRSKDERRSNENRSNESTRTDDDFDFDDDVELKNVSYVEKHSVEVVASNTDHQRFDDDSLRDNDETRMCLILLSNKYRLFDLVAQLKNVDYFSMTVASVIDREAKILMKSLDD